MIAGSTTPKRGHNRNASSHFHQKEGSRDISPKYQPSNRPENPHNEFLSFAEKFNKVTFRDFQNNTRLNINNIEYAEAKVKRDRQMSYWKNNVINNFLPPIRHK